MTSNDFSSTLTASASAFTIPFKQNSGPYGSMGVMATITPTSQLLYPCTVWVTPSSGSSVVVNYCFDGVTNVPWGPGTVTSFTTNTINSCPGSITFKLVSGTGSKIGIT